MNKYLESHEIKDIKNYCQNRCIKIVNEKIDKEENLPYYRGVYKGYLYMIRISNHILKKSITLKRYELYNHLKNELRKVKYDCMIPGPLGRGIIDSFYDLMNYISINEI